MQASATSLGPPDLFVLFGQVAPRGCGRRRGEKILASVG